MARPGITREQVTQAADALVAEGQNPSIEAIRKRLGTGSPNTVHKHLTEWRAARPQTPAAVREIPASLTAALAAEIERATAQARAEIEGQLVEAQAEAAALADAGEGLEADREALTDQVADLTSERDILAGKAAQQAADLDALAQRIEREQQAAESARVELATARLKIEAHAERQAEQAQEMRRLRDALETATAAKVAGEQSAAVLAAQLEGLRAQVEELREARGRIEAERDQARDQANQAQGEAREQARQIAALGSELAALRTEVADHREARGRIEAERDQARQQANQARGEAHELTPVGPVVDEPPKAPAVPELSLEPTPKPKAPTRRRGSTPQGQTGDQA